MSTERLQTIIQPSQKWGLSSPSHGMNWMAGMFHHQNKMQFNIYKNKFYNLIYEVSDRIKSWKDSSLYKKYQIQKIDHQ